MHRQLLCLFASLSCAMWFAGVSACTSSPRNGAHIDDVDHIDVSGLVPWKDDPATGLPRARVHLDVYDASHNTWSDDGAPAAADTTPSTTDSGGTDWYRFSYSVWGGRPELWIGSFANHSMSMKFRTYVQGKGHTGDSYDAAHDILFASLDAGDATDQCLRDHQNDPGSTLIEACRSKASDITVTADCGSQGKLCCGTGWPEDMNYQCDAGLRCSYRGKCGACGGAGQTPCHGTECYPLAGSGQVCHAKCDSGSFDGESQLCKAAPTPPPPPPPPPPPATRITRDLAVNCLLVQPFWSGYPQFICSIQEDPVKQARLVSITNPNTSLQHYAMLVKDNADLTEVCEAPDDASPDQYIMLAPGQTVDLQSALGHQPPIDGGLNYSLCVVPSMVDASEATAYLSNYTESYVP